MTPSRSAAKAASLSLALLCGFGVTTSAQAAPTSYSGLFSVDNELWLSSSLDITSATGGRIEARTFSHSGGTNGNGTVIAAGGFAPVLTLLDSTGNLVTRNIGSGNPPPAVCPVGFCWDAYLSFDVVTPGSYTLYLSQDDNLYDEFSVEPVIADRFTQALNPNYFNSFKSPYEGQRSGAWALDIEVTNNSTATTVPEPTGTALVATALAALALTRRRRAA